MWLYWSSDAQDDAQYSAQRGLRAFSVPTGARDVTLSTALGVDGGSLRPLADSAGQGPFHICGYCGTEPTVGRATMVLKDGIRPVPTSTVAWSTPRQHQVYRPRPGQRMATGPLPRCRLQRINRAMVWAHMNSADTPADHDVHAPDTAPAQTDRYGVWGQRDSYRPSA